MRNAKRAARRALQRQEDTSPRREDLSPVAISGWGHYPVVDGYQLESEDLEKITQGVALTRGLGRSYGDASLPATKRDVVAATPRADRLLSFDEQTGILRAEAGCPLVKLNRLFFSRGWFTPVTPGTHYVTLGGMAAADVHGKNHHVEGCFGEHVQGLKIRLADGTVLECSDDQERDLFRATLGGMGLTGHILEVGVRMHRIASPWIWQESERLSDFESVLERLQTAGRDWPYTVCWADFMARGDGLGRGLLMKGRWAEPAEAAAGLPRWRNTIEFPAQLPSWALQPWMIQIGNVLNYWRHGAAMRAGIVHPETFFYPLDVIQNWYRVYGRRGFTQYQCVLPSPSSHPRHRSLLNLLRKCGATTFLCVIKDCGPEGKGMISFPKPGVSYALDFPVDDRTQQLVDSLNDLVAAEGGRVYLAKDAFTRAEHFRAMEPRLDAWNAVRRKWDPEGRLRSAQSIRVLGDRA